jgi:hypothetical protein
MRARLTTTGDLPHTESELPVGWLIVRARSATDGAGDDRVHREEPGTQEGRIMAETYTGEAYCVKCKEKRHFTGEVKISDSGRRMAQGSCPTCGTKVNRILGKN